MTADDRLRLAFLGLHPDRVRKLLLQWGGAGAVVGAIRRGRVEVAEGVRDRLDRDVGAELASIGASAVMREKLPDGIAVLPDAPDLVFVRGSLPPSPGVAIVGTRRATAYGLRLARAFGHAVGAAGWPVVSGLARGIDGAAHVGCVQAAGIGVAVLGSGVDVAYPPEHARLAQQLLDSGGAVVSEYPPGSKPEPWRFPPRNRIISGLASVVVVVEAGVRGGALITAARALEQGRLVLAVPGDVDRETSRGCNLLIRDGAHPVLDVDDLLTSISFVLGDALHPARSEDPVVEAVGPGGRTLEDLAVALGWSAAETLRRVALLETEGALRVDGGMVSRR